MADGNPALRAAVNHGNPAIAATARPAEFTGRGVVAARGAVPAQPAAGAEHRAGIEQPQGERERALQERAARDRAAEQERALQERAARERGVEQPAQDR
jgi:hypothetical protein